MKTTTLKKAIHIVLFSLVLMATIIITKNTVRNVRHLYDSEKTTNNAMTCFTDLIY